MIEAPWLDGITVVEEGHDGDGPVPIDEERFWSARPELEHLRTFARSRMCSPWAVMGVVLTRIIAATPYSVTLPPIVGGRASLNLAVGLVGRSGDGKGAAEAAARDAFSLGTRLSSFEVHKLGSGQGLAHGFMHYEPKQGPVRHADSCLFVMQEIDTVGGLSSQRGSTLLPELRSALMGEALGHLFVDFNKRLEVPAHSYRLALTIGIQPARAGVLLDDADGGTPQRVVWLPTDDPDAPTVDPAQPPTMVWQVPTWPSELPVCRSAVEEIVAARDERRRGRGEPLDGHRLLLREKIAAALDLLAGRAEVSEEAWRLAGIVLSVSDRARGACIKAISEKADRANSARAEREGERALIVGETIAEATLRRVSAAVLRRLQDGEWHSHADLRRSIRADARRYFEEAIERLEAAGQLEREDRGTGKRYRHA